MQSMGLVDDHLNDCPAKLASVYADLAPHKSAYFTKVECADNTANKKSLFTI